MLRLRHSVGLSPLAAFERRVVIKKHTTSLLRPLCGLWAALIWTRLWSLLTPDDEMMGMIGMRSNTYLDYHTTTPYQLQRLDSFQKEDMRIG